MIGTRQRATAPYRPAANRGGASRFSCQAKPRPSATFFQPFFGRLTSRSAWAVGELRLTQDALTESQHRLAELAKHDDPSPPVGDRDAATGHRRGCSPAPAKSAVARVQWQSVVERNGRSSAVRRGDRRNRERRDADPHDNRDLEKSETASHCSRSIPASCWSRCCHCRGRVPEVVDRSPDLARLVSVHDLQEVAR